MRVYLRASTSVAVIGFTLVAMATPATAQIQFQDVSTQTNMTGHTESWGASVGDINGDNCPDLYVQGHRSYPRFYRNTCDGSFEDIAYEVDPGRWIAKPQDDKHGAGWADFDNDGDQDLMQTVSATGNAILMVNENGKFVDRTSLALLTNDSTGRMALWLDYNKDGLLDIAQTYLQNSFLRRRTTTGIRFADDKTGTKFTCPGRIEYAQLADLNNNGSLEFICGEVDTFPNRIFDTGTRPFVDITASMPTTALVSDSIIADFNNDGWQDFVLVTGLMHPSGAAQTSPTHIESWLRTSVNASVDKGFTFSAPGNITVTVDNRDTGFPNANPDVFQLNSNGTNTAASDPIKISYQQNQWQVLIARDKGEQQAYVRIDTASNITNFIVSGLESAEGPRPLRHLVNSATGLTIANNTGLANPPVSCVSGIAGDFDNDMWVDIYLVCRDGPSNIANRLYRNQGNGTFQLVSSHGAEGPVGTDIDKIGVGENVVVFDYDGDGRLDLGVLNGLLYYPVRMGGPDKLFRNTTTGGNHWLEFDLRGTTSNRSAVGAKVFVTAGGLTQLREQNGGYHRYSQNHQREHFGLGINTLASVRVVWPSGTVTQLQNVQADRLYEISEAGTLTQKTFGPPIHTKLQPGDECGQPPYNLEYGPALMLWRDCPGGAWHLRAKGGREKVNQLVTQGTITADTAFNNVTNTQLNSGDSVVLSNNNSLLTFTVKSWFTNDKGFNFETGGQSTSCFQLSRKDIPALIVGGSKKRINYSFDLVSMQACAGPPPPPPPDPSCGEPSFNRQTEPGVYVWKDCTASGTGTQWRARFASGGTTWSSYQGMVTSDMPLNATAVGLSSPDTFDAVPGDNQVEFQLWSGGSGIDGFDLLVPGGAHSCFAVGQFKPGAQILLGAGKQAKGSSFALDTLGPCN